MPALDPRLRDLAVRWSEPVDPRIAGEFDPETPPETPPEPSLYEIRLRPPAAVADPDVLAVCVTVSTIYQDVAVAKAKAALGNRWTGRDGATVKSVRIL